MNIKEFLIENYIYIIIVLVLIIITIIGFLADKKKNDEKKVKTMSGTIEDNKEGNAIPYQQQQPVGGVQNMNYNAINQNMPNQQIDFSQMPNSSVTPINNPNQMPTNNQLNQLFDNNQLNQVNNNLNQMPFNNQLNQINNPIKDTSINNLGTSNINTVSSIPTPVNEINNYVPNNNQQPVEPINQNIYISPEPMYQPLQQDTPIIQPVQPMSNAPIESMNTAMANNFNLPNNMTNNMMTNMEGNMGINNINNSMQQVSNVVPTPVNPNNNPIPAPMPAAPNPQIQPTQIPNEVENAIPTSVITPQPVSFVYGPQQTNKNNSNNQFMQ